MGLDYEGAESREDVWKMKLAKGEFIDMQFDVPGRTIRAGANMPLGWLLEA